MVDRFRGNVLIVDQSIDEEGKRFLEDELGLYASYWDTKKDIPTLIGRPWIIVKWTSKCDELCSLIKSNDRLFRSIVTVIYEKHQKPTHEQFLSCDPDSITEIHVDRSKFRQHYEELVRIYGNFAEWKNISLGNMQFNERSQRLTWRGRLVKLSPTETTIMVQFLNFPDRIFSHEDLVKLVSRGRERYHPSNISKMISRIRRTLIDHGVENPIKAWRGLGFSLVSSHLH